MSAHRILAALAGVILIFLVAGLGTGTASASTGTHVLDGQAVPRAAGMLPAQAPEAADDSGRALADVLCAVGLALFLGGVAFASQGIAVEALARS